MAQKQEEILVGIVMGSDSDLPVVKAAAVLFEELGIGFEMRVLSAHRTPEQTAEYTRSADGRGLQVLIAAAGGAAHLPGVMASLTNLPVIGIPVRTSGLGGVDSLYSIVQMPRGIPVATVGINNSKNAALLAARIISVSRPELKKRLAEYTGNAASEVLDKSERMQQEGWREYLASMEK
ncbi:MAG: 5-(carboxyamino)imidazole ribonucleotide mutase [Spirochaetales bacterium]|nr:5-(carboxyamino)imidazole ribonucleotide mutase [Spirochaetales bacterium]MCF7937848.1 5-(carboxyamino)imidazole ribonucleotide mutase [Spirochaetales bacterium]